MEPTPLTLIQQDLLAEEFDARLLGIDDKNFYERLFVVFDPDDKGRDQILQIMFINDLLNLSGQADEPEDMFLLQFTLELPFRVPEAAAAEVARLLLALNRVLPVGALGMTEPEGTVYFNYALSNADRRVEDVVTANTVGLIEFYIPGFAKLIEAVADGSRKRQDVIKQLIEEQVMPPPSPVRDDPNYNAVPKA